MPPIEGQFHSKLRLIKDDADAVIGIAASGPISHWDDDARSARIDVTIKQDGQVVARGHTADDVQAKAPVWMVTAAVESPVQIEGTADGTATAIVHTATLDATGSWSNPSALTLD